MKRVLGLDLGTTSIGWAFVQQEGAYQEPNIRLGVRITPLTVDERESFNKGQSISTNRDRTQKRTARKTLDRYQLRRKRLLYLATKYNWISDSNAFTQQLVSGRELWYLRAKAVSEKIELDQLLKVLMHLNGKRGFKSNRKAVAKEEQEGGFLQTISDNDRMVKEQDFTIGQWYVSTLEDAEKNKKPIPSIKGITFSRALHREEFDRIWTCQQQFYPSLTEELRKEFGDYTLFYQRRLKSQKRLISKCRFMPDCRVIPSSHPLFELFRAWLDVNHLVVKTGVRQEILHLDLSVKAALVAHLHALPSKNPTKPKIKMTANEVKKFLAQHLGGTTKDYEINFEELNGASTILSLKAMMAKAGIKDESLLQWEPLMQGQAFDKQPLLRLWHNLYSIEDHDDLVETLVRHFGWTHEQSEIMADLGFKPQHGGLSARAIRRILPHLMEGNVYSTACQLAHFKHSDSETLEEKQNRVLAERLTQVPRGQLRNPVVEKILNQMVNVVNAILEDPELGRPDEIHIEMGRELTATAKQRERMSKAINDSKKEHERIRDILVNELGLKRVTRRDIQKYKLGEQCNWISIYSGQPITRAQVFGDNPQYDVDHIIPQSRLFDDSQSNKVLCESEWNREKGNQTAYDYIASKGSAALEAFLQRVAELESDPRQRTKASKLRMKGVEIPDDFINRQLSESQFIAAEALKRLKSICREIVPTVGSITAHLRKEWGLEELIKEVNYSKYEAIGQVQTITTRDGKQVKQISDWSKRDDHRHHALDALTVALTNRSMVQQLNNLHQMRENEEQLSESKAFQLAKSRRKFEVPHPQLRMLAKEALEKVLVSYKPGKRVASWSRSTIKQGQGKVQQRRILIPRGQLHLETVYGQNKRYLKEPLLLSKIGSADQIIQAEAAALWQERVDQYGGDVKKAFSSPSLKKKPFLVNGKAVQALACWDTYFTQRVRLNEKIRPETIIDARIRQLVQERVSESGMAALQEGNLEEYPIWQNEAKRIPVKYVRIAARPNNAIALREKEDGSPKDFVVTGNNHHIALYQKADGKYHFESVSLLEAIARKQAGDEVIKTQHEQGHRFVASFQQNEYFSFSAMDQQELQANTEELSASLYRVQKLTLSDAGAPDIVFRHHLETDIKRSEDFATIRARSSGSLPKFKVRLNCIGQIVQITEIPYAIA